jgi:hypothetical protein|nr:MAG TPA_asm: ssDNA binding protein [Bacteriophage sp.]
MTNNNENTDYTEQTEQTENARMDNRRFICTVDNRTFEGKRAIVNARNSAKSLNSYGEGKRLDVVGAYTAAAVRPQTGQPCTNVYLFTADGSTYFSQSEGINRSILDIADMFPDMNAENGGIPVVVNSTALGGGKSIKSLQIL